jgi:hypothetical protein
MVTAPVGQEQNEVLNRKWSSGPQVRFVVLMLYYLAILVGLFALYGRGNFSSPPFVYQNF